MARGLAAKLLFQLGDLRVGERRGGRDLGARQPARGIVQLDTKVDPSLLGGLIVKVGSRMIDSSLRTKLEGLRAAMRGN